MPAVVNNFTQWIVKCDGLWRKKQAVVSEDAAQWLSYEDSRTDIELNNVQINEWVKNLWNNLVIPENKHWQHL